MTAIIISCTIGYLLGCLSPSWLVSKVKQVNIREAGSGNLGATNVFLHVSKVFGLLIMVFDILKCFIAIHIVRILFAGITYVPALAGAFAIIGHIYPFYLKFKGGKGTACLAGTILGLTPRLFLPFALICILIGIITDYLCLSPISAALSYPILCGIVTQSFHNFVILLVTGVIITFHHFDNLKRISNHTEPKLREHFKKSIS